MKSQLLKTLGCYLSLCSFSIVVGQIELTRIDGSKSEASSITIADGQVKSGDTSTDLNEFRLIDFRKPIKASNPVANVGIIGGGSLGADSLSLSDETFVLKNVAGEIRLGVDAVTKIRFKKEELPLYSNAKPKEDLDQLFVKIKGSYQTVPGIVDTISDSEIAFLYDEDAITFPLADVYGLVLAQGASPVKAETNGSVLLTEGSKLNCQIKEVSEKAVSATVGGLADVEIPLQVVSRLEIKSDRLVFLSDLEPTSVANQKGSVFVRSLQKDQNISGGKLVLKNRTTKQTRNYQKGLGTKSGMTVKFENSGYDRFVSTLGIDAGTNGNGLCDVKVLGDGKELFATSLAGTDAPIALDLEITGMDEIELIIEFGKDFLDLSDHVNWCDARFVKKQK